ncbi:lytic murein transglycosylase [Pseudooceanicola sp. LIPI14-2-Ac024]|uniref:lytic murein transglycosylase n=1 Tax=Pseudooceanicola sp. LIPI14-2-Ac024 TaxID=3344875 RepID=UPI0035CF8D6F
MRATRRAFMMGGAALALAGCVAGGGGGGTTGGAVVVMRPVPNPGYDQWVAAFRQRAGARGISQSTLNEAFRGAGYLPGVVERDRNQTEVQRSLEDYLAITSNPTKVRDGRAALSRHRALLSEVEGRYGVPAEVVAAIWGMESNYGTRRGDIPVISATSTLAYDGRRGDFFEKQLMAALKVLQRGDVSADRMTGSWAGAMGHTQFIPTTFDAYAVDFRGDGRRDIWGDDPTDGLASAAAYLSRSGWRRGEPWGHEVRLPAGGAAVGATRSLSDWGAAGVQRTDGGRLAGGAQARLIQPAGAAGPAFLILPNFRVFLRYNNAEKYAIAAGHLSDRIGGGPELSTNFPPDQYGLTIDERRQLQAGLTAAGYDTGTPDGVLGKKTEAAIAAYERANGMPVTGQPSRGLLARLR